MRKSFQGKRLAICCLLRCVSSARIYVSCRIFVREIYSFSIDYPTTASNLTKLLAIFASNGAWLPSNPIRLSKRYEGTHHVPHETIRHTKSTHTNTRTHK